MDAVQLGTTENTTDYKKLSLYIGTAIVVILFIFGALMFFEPVTAFTFGGGASGGAGAGR